MEIAIVSGKGGAGKTTLATRLFQSSPGDVLLDCDVEAPNCALLLDTVWERREVFEVEYPEIRDELCTGCGACASFCAFGAMLAAPDMAVPIPERCHACGGCALVCPHDAVIYGRRPAGEIAVGYAGGSGIVSGELALGEFSGTALIRRLRDAAGELEGTGTVWIDGPPGTGCSAVAAVDEADFVVLVAEPTPFGLADMTMAVEMLRKLGRPFGVVVNKVGIGDDRIFDYCRDEAIPVLGEIPFSLEMARAYSRGRDGWRDAAEPDVFARLARVIKAEAGRNVRDDCGPVGELGELEHLGEQQAQVQTQTQAQVQKGEARL